MAWQPWSAGAPGVVPGLSGLPSVVNPAPAVLPAGSQYTPEQWAQMQQQNWQQWAQWQQQYQQWHQQYGAEYQKSMTALSQAAQGTNYQSAVANTSVPPPLPKDTKPPPPPEEPPKELLGPAQTKNIPAQPNFMSDPPPNFNTAPPQSQTQTQPPIQAQSQPQPLFNAASLPPRNQPPPNMRSNNTGNFNYNKNPNRSTNQYNDMSRNAPIRQEFQGDKRYAPQPPFVKKPKLDEAPQRSSSANPNEDMSETEKRFVKQFTEWEAQFNKWKEQNMNHPDKEQYREYEKKWEAWRTQLLERREQMRRKRLGIAEKESPKPTQVPQPLLSVKFPPSFNKDLDTTKPPPLLSRDAPAIKDSSIPNDTILSASKDFAILKETLPKDLGILKDTLLPLRSPSASKDFSMMKDTLPLRNPSAIKDFGVLKDFAITMDILPEPSTADDGTHELTSRQLDEDENDDFLKMTKSSDGIPGLDLVMEGKDDEKRQDVESDTEKAKDSDQDGKQDSNKGPDFEALSKGINNILGDQKLLNMLSMVSQNQNNQLPSGSIDTISRIPANADFQSNFRTANENLEQGADRWSNPDQQEYFTRGKDNTSNYDEHSRSSFGGRGGDFEWRDRQGGGNQDDFNYDGDDYDGNYQNEDFGGNYDRQDMFGGQNNFRGADNFRPNDNFRGPNNFRDGSHNFRGQPDNFRGQPGNFRGGPGNFRGTPDNFKGGPDNFRGGSGNFRNEPDNFRGGPDGFRGGPNTFMGGPDNFRGGRGNFRGGRGNFRGGSDHFASGSDNFGGDPDHFTSGSDNFGGGPNNFRGTPDNFRDGSGNFRGRSDNFRGGQNSFRGGKDDFRGGSGSFKGGPEGFGDDNDADNFRSANRFKGSDDVEKSPDNSKSSGNFKGGNDGRKIAFEPPPSDNFRNRFEPPKDQQNFNRNDNFNRFDADQRISGDFVRRPSNFQDREFGNNRDFNNFRPGDTRSNYQENFRQNDRRNFDEEAITPNERNPRHGNFGHGFNDFNRGSNFQGNRGNFDDEPNRESIGNFENADDNMGDWQDENDFDRNQSHGEGQPHTVQGLDFVPPPSSIHDEEPAGDTEMTEKEDDDEKDVPLWYPSQIIEYDHKSLKTDDADVSLEPLRTFDYRHKNVNRIPFPQRPQWLSGILKKYPEFDFVLQRTYEQPFSRYSERYERFPEIERYENRRNNREPQSTRRGVEEPNRSSRRYDDFAPSFNRRQPAGPSFPKKDHDRHIDDAEMIEVNREKRYDNFRNKSPNTIPIIDLDDPRFDKPDNEKFLQIQNKPLINSNVTLIQDILSPPGRYNRAPRIVIILRGPPGSGKTFLAKLIKDKEVENGGSAPRILSLDDYFMVEQEKEAEVDGKKTKVKEMVYEYEECMENAYRMSLFKAFKKTVTDGYFPFIIVDNVNDKVKYFGDMWSYAKQNGFQVYICQMEFDLSTCTKRNIHNRSEGEIEKIISNWEATPLHHPILDATSLIQAGSIPDVEMEEINSPPSDDFDSLDAEDRMCRSKWDNFDCSIDNLAKLDGTNKPLRTSKTMEDYLQCDDDWVCREAKPGQKRVRWADLEERKKQEKMRAIGFVVGQTNWDRMLDPTMGSSALTQTKYIERVKGSRFHPH